MDLIAICRLLYAKERAAGGHPMKLQQIADIGRKLKVALDLCKSGQDNMGMRAAWSYADDAVEALGELLKEERALPLLETVGARMLRLKRG